MSKLSKRDIELFVAGALALHGFRVLIALPYFFFTSTPMLWGRFISSLLTALALPIGIADLLGRASAILCAQIYLWIIVVSACVVIPVYHYSVPGSLTGGFLWRNIPELLAAVVLLALIFWSRSRQL